MRPRPSDAPRRDGRRRERDRRARTLGLTALNVHVRIRCGDALTRALLRAHYAPMRRRIGAPDLSYTVGGPGERLARARDGARPLTAADPGDALLRLDQDLIVRLQRLRPDLYFIHAGVLEFEGRTCLFVAPSGGGKSTTVWALVHHGFRYLSDELGPIDLRTMAVQPYPRALTLKSLPPPPYHLPRGTLWTSRGFHVTPRAMASGIGTAPAPLTAIFFLHYAPAGPASSVKTMSAAQAGARLYANALNPLAHPEAGLDAAIRIASHTACFMVSTADLAATCALVKATVDRLPRAKRV